MPKINTPAALGKLAQFPLCIAAKTCTNIAFPAEIARLKRRPSDTQVGRSNNTTKEVVMLTSIRGLAAASIATGLALSAAPAFAEDSAIPADFDLAAVAAAKDVTIDVADLGVATEPVGEKVSMIGATSTIEVFGQCGAGQRISLPRH
ncbi:hypothetical protein [Altererythrobacter sp. BO-6]|uniref:hypothetical protein n=1 Tax=Altererythrobacter sp. BO-6 TaxID=2604537 RepID=UPI001F492EDF|nr:hypothetical protein [Altererythrobacter sp. BO-6]